MTMHVSETKSTELSTKAARWRKAMSDAACGPLVIAGEVVALAEVWPAHKAEADGLSVSGWLEKTFGDGRGLSWFQRRADALARIGEHARRTWHHEAAVWAAQHVRDELTLKRLDHAVLDARKANGGNPLTVVSVRRVARDILGTAKAPRRVGCARCEKLEQALREAGVDVPE